jgi:hypothetical protein
MLPNLKTLEIQTDPETGKLCRQMGVKRVTKKPGRWIDKVEKYHWMYKYIYVEEKGHFIVETDYFNNFVRRIENTSTSKAVSSKLTWTGTGN